MGLLDNLLNKGKRAIKREATRVARRELKKLGLDTSLGTPGRAGSPREPTSRGRKSTTRRAASRRVDDARWYVPDHAVSLHGISVRLWGYVGSTLAKQSGKGNESSLINPQLPVREERSTTAPTKIDYAELTPAQRYTFLRWLAGGRRDPQAGAWMPRLFVYGLERRVHLDLAAGPVGRAVLEELRAIGDELEALRKVYGVKDVANLADTVFVLRLLAGDPPDAMSVANASGMALQLLLAYTARERRPVNADLAWAWALENERSAVIRRQIRMAKQLFERRFANSLADSILLQPTATVEPTYVAKAGNPGVRNLSIDVSTFPGWSDPDEQKEQIRALFSSVGADITAYDKASRSDGFDANSLSALSLLPLGLLEAAHPTLIKLREWLNGAISKPYGTPVPASSVLAEFGYTQPKPSRPDCERIAGLLERLGYGIQPDVRVSGDTFAADSRVVLFRMPQPLPTESDLTATLLQLRFATAVAMANKQMSQAELTTINGFIEQSAAHPSERGHLYARLIYLSLTPVRLTGLTKRIATLTDQQIEEITTFLLTLATCEGNVAPEEMTVLGKIWKLLGLKPEALSSSLHQAMTITTSAPSTGLDPDRVARTQQETEHISRLLGDIFADEESVAPPTPAVEPEADAIGALNAGQSALLKDVLGTGEPISESAFTAMAESHNLLPNAALDAINQHAIDTCGEPLLEHEGDMLVFNEWARDQLAE